jgi:fermentation-respiration switch protein FrsA (DUF1100 family)
MGLAPANSANPAWSPTPNRRLPWRTLATAGPLLIIGESLGAGVAAAASVRHREAIAGLLLITPWDRLEHVASHHYPMLPVKWLLRDRYDSVGHLATIGRPVLVVVAGDDQIVPGRFGGHSTTRWQNPSACR